MAPSRPASTTFASTMPGSTIPVAILFATAVPNTKTATKLNTPAQITAAVGLNTLVETTVAIELALS
jgi:hypothetical protein